MGKAKICGLIVDRREVGDAGAFDHMTDEELVREATRMARELGIAGLHLVEDDPKSRHDQADIDWGHADVRYVPIADIAPTRSPRRLWRAATAEWSGRAPLRS